MSEQHKRPLGLRLALRHEGDFWNAYIALETTMEKAILIGSIAFGSVVDNPERKTAFMTLMKGIVEDAAFATGITVQRWGEPQDAPEAERGHA